MSRDYVIKELGTLALHHVEANWAWCAINNGQPIELVLMTVFKHCLMLNKQLSDQLEKYKARTIPPVVIQYPGNAQEFIELQNITQRETDKLRNIGRPDL